MPIPPAQLQERAYAALTTYLTTHAHQVLCIEILPPEFSPPDAFLLSENSDLGLPKKTLVLAFAHARTLFFTSKDSPSHRTEVLEATCVLLLFDPEHLTAANFRKRHLQTLPLGESRDEALRREMCFLDSILTSPLHRQTKSPTLWHHRWWVHSTFSLPSASPASLRAELESVCKAGERHPKNYYAWQYARRIFSVALGGKEWAREVGECVLDVKNWCCVHPGDVSGWMFFAWLLERVRAEEKEDVMRMVVDYATSVQLTNESLWVFVRIVLANGAVGEKEGSDIVEMLRGCLRGNASSLFEERAARALDWVERSG